MKQFLIVNTYCNTLYIKTLYTATFPFNLQYDETQVALVIIILTAYLLSHRSKISFVTNLPLPWQRYAVRLGDPVKLQDFTLRCPNLSKKATKDHNNYDNY